MRFSLSVAHVNELTWAHKLTAHFVDILWNNYMSVLSYDRLQLAMVIIKHERGYQHVVLGLTHTYKLRWARNEHCSPRYRKSCKKSCSSDFQFSQSRNSKIDLKLLVTTPVFSFTLHAFVARKVEKVEQV